MYFDLLGVCAVTFYFIGVWILNRYFMQLQPVNYLHVKPVSCFHLSFHSWAVRWSIFVMHLYIGFSLFFFVCFFSIPNKKIKQKLPKSKKLSDFHEWLFSFDSTFSEEIQEINKADNFIDLIWWPTETSTEQNWSPWFVIVAIWSWMPRCLFTCHPIINEWLKKTEGSIAASLR